MGVDLCGDYADLWVMRRNTPPIKSGAIAPYGAASSPFSARAISLRVFSTP